MTLKQEDREALVKIRLQRAKETMLEVKSNMELEYWRLVANRLYYSCYYAAVALLIKNGITAHTHAGVMNQFGLHFVTKGIISNEEGKFFKQLFNLRQSGDYDDWFYIDENDILPLVSPAEKFITEIEKLINNNKDD
jgi:uncharacterized protein (UPF0332 family)